MENKNVLITDKVHPLLITGLQELSWHVVYDTSIDNTKLQAIIQNYQGLIINSKILMDRTMIDLSKGLLFIARLG